MRFRAVDMNMSAFVEAQMALFLQMTEPFAPLMLEVSKGGGDRLALKMAMRQAFSETTVHLGDVSISSPLAGGFAPSFLKMDTDVNTDK